MSGSQRYRFSYRGRPLELQIVEDRELLLRLDGIVRKRRDRSGVSCVYVWTNIELNWEEHHFIEARWWPATGRVSITVNREPLLEVARVDYPRTRGSRIPASGG